MVEEKQENPEITQTPEITPFESFNGWHASQGDYIRTDEAYAQDAERILRRVQIIKRIAIIAGISAGLILFLIILNFIANI